MIEFKYSLSCLSVYAVQPVMKVWRREDLASKPGRLFKDTGNVMTSGRYHELRVIYEEVCK
jgi:hypothetical protein